MCKVKHTEVAKMGDLFNHMGKKYVAVYNKERSCEGCAAYGDMCQNFPLGCSNYDSPFTWVKYKPLKEK